MLGSELSGVAYSKTEHRRQLSRLLDNRSESAIERKHGNISAVLIELNFPYISGYKPYVNYQRMLFKVVKERLAEDVVLQQLVSREVGAPPEAPSIDDILEAWVDPPRASHTRLLVRDASNWRDLAASAVGTNYLEREARNRDLGAAGEQFVLEFERARLISRGKERLARSIEHVALTRGEGAGFDVLSYEESGRERLIEVKTTRYGAQTPFFVSRNEVALSQVESEIYCLYRVFDFRSTPHLYSVSGPIPQGFSLEPTQYRARLS